jgi:hypothetical protein
MPYYPKSQVKTNLYTNGTSPTLYKIEDQTIYSGYYHQLSNGKYFSGKTPQDTPSFELTTFTRTSFPSPITLNSVPVYPVLTPEGTEIYVSYPNDFSSQEYPKFEEVTLNSPSYNPNYPSPQDYQIGEFRRYFCKKTNEIKYIEIDKNYFDSLAAKSPNVLWSLYLPFYLDWQLTGNEEQVARVNKNNAELTAQRLRLPGLLEYLRFDFTKYYKP